MQRGCGDGYRERGPESYEACDDGNLAIGDACSSDCEPTVAVVSSSAGVWSESLGAHSVAVDGAGNAMLWWREETEVDDEVRAVDRVMVFGFGGDATADLEWSTVPERRHLVGLDRGWAVATLDAGGQVRLESLSVDLGVRFRREIGVGHEVALARSGSRLVVALAEEDALVFVAFDGFGNVVSNWRRDGRVDQVAAAFDDTRGLLVTSTGGRLEGLRFDGEGFVSERPLGDGTDPAVAHTGEAFVVAYTSRGDDSYGDVHARVVDSAGVVGDAMPLAARPRYVERRAHLARLASGVVATWEERGSYGGAGFALLGVDAPRVDALAAHVAPPGDAGGLAIAGGDSANVWIAWSEGPPAGAPGAIRSVFLSLLPEGL